MNPQQKNYYDPETEQDGRQGDGVVLKPRPFKPLKNTKTNNFFSYSYAVAERNASANNDFDIIWVHGAPKELQKRIDTVEKMHRDAVQLHEELVQAMKDEYKPGIRLATKAFNKQLVAIDEFIYPVSEREYVESKEAKRFRLEQVNELTLDAASIAALQSGMQAPMGSTADASIAQAKLEVAEQRIKELEELAKTAKLDAMGLSPEDTPASEDASAVEAPKKAPAAPKRAAAPKPK